MSYVDYDTGRRIPVVRLLWEQIDWVQFPAARLISAHGLGYNNPMRQYLDLLEYVLKNGKQKTDPQKVGNIAVCGYQMRFNLDDGFPLLTTRSMKGSWKAMVYELLWFLSGSTKVADLNKDGVHLWDIWATPEICAPLGLETGDLGPVYGKQ